MGWGPVQCSRLVPGGRGTSTLPSRVRHLVADTGNGFCGLGPALELAQATQHEAERKGPASTSGPIDLMFEAHKVETDLGEARGAPTRDSAQQGHIADRPCCWRESDLLRGARDPSATSTPGTVLPETGRPRSVRQVGVTVSLAFTVSVEHVRVRACVGVCTHIYLRSKG